MGTESLTKATSLVLGIYRGKADFEVPHQCRCEDEHSVKCFIQYQIRIFPSIQDLVCNLSKVVAMLCRLVVLVNR